MTLEEFIQSLDFDEYDYFYHITGRNNSKKMFSQGLYVKGDNIANANNIVETTTLPLTKDMVESLPEFKQYLDVELSSFGLRDTSEFIVLGSPKSRNRKIVSKFSRCIDGEYYLGIISPHYIMGYFSNQFEEFIINDSYEFGTDEYYQYLLYR